VRIGILISVYNNSGWGLGQVLDKVQGMGINTVEMNSGGFGGNVFCHPQRLLASTDELKRFREVLERRSISISSLSVHGNPLHPNKEIAEQHHDDWRSTVLLAEKLGVNIVNVFSGCPGDCETSKYPNWIVSAWPEDFQDLVKWQWEEKLIPYWRQEAKYARDHGVDKLGFEMHPGFMVYNSETLLRLREAVGREIGANLDPSHLFWQGMDTVTVIRALGKEEAIFHFHAKDTYVNRLNVELNGVLDWKPYANRKDRAWYFRTIGFGNPKEVWQEIVCALKNYGYDYVLSIEHEDKMMETEEGLLKALECLRSII